MTPNDTSFSQPDDVARLFRLDGCTALVTGGTGVLGKALATGLGLAGARVAVASRTRASVEATVEELRALDIAAHGVVLDVCDLPSLQAAANEIERELGTVDILVNAAGGNRPEATAVLPERSFFQLDPQAIRNVMDLNLMGGAVLPSMVFGERMVQADVSGKIVNISSVAALEPLTRVMGYAASKAAVANFTQWLAVHFARELNVPIRVNALMPGFFLTEQNRFLLTDEEGLLTERGRQILEHTPMGRFGTAQELVAACVYLCSPAASFVTGTTLTVDGGFTAFSGV